MPRRRRLMFTSGPPWRGDRRLRGRAALSRQPRPGGISRAAGGERLSVVAHVAEDEGCGGHTIWLARRDEATQDAVPCRARRAKARAGRQSAEASRGQACCCGSTLCVAKIGQVSSSRSTIIGLLAKNPTKPPRRPFGDGRPPYGRPDLASFTPVSVRINPCRNSRDGTRESALVDLVLHQRSNLPATPVRTAPGRACRAERAHKPGCCSRPGTESGLQCHVRDASAR